MSHTVPVSQGKLPTEEQTRLVAFFDEIEKKQLEFLNEAGKRIIELSTTLLGLLFAISAFGDKFPPAYLENNPPAQVLAASALLFYLLATGAGIQAIQPRRFTRRSGNLLDEMRAELERALNTKAGWFRAGSIFFGIGSLSLAALALAVIFAI